MVRQQRELLAAGAAAFLAVSTFLCTWSFGFWISGETDRLRTWNQCVFLGSWLQRYVKEQRKGSFCLVVVDSDSKVVQVTSHGILAGSLLAPVQRLFWKEKHQSIINRNDVRSAVVAETVLVAKAAAAKEGASCCVQSGTWEARQKFQPVHKVQFFVKVKVGMSTSVVRGSPDEILSRVIGTDGLDVYATVHGKIVNLSSTLSSAGIVGDCIVYIHHRLRGGSREDVPGQWTW